MASLDNLRSKKLQPTYALRVLLHNFSSLILVIISQSVETSINTEWSIEVDTSLVWKLYKLLCPKQQQTNKQHNQRHS